MTRNTYLNSRNQDGWEWTQDYEDEPISADEMRAIMCELESAYGDELTDEIVEHAIEENLESKRTPKPISGGMSHLERRPKQVAS